MNSSATLMRRSPSHSGGAATGHRSRAHRRRHRTPTPAAPLTPAHRPCRGRHCAARKRSRTCGAAGAGERSHQPVAKALARLGQGVGSRGNALVFRSANLTEKHNTIAFEGDDRPKNRAKNKTERASRRVTTFRPADAGSCPLDTTTANPTPNQKTGGEHERERQSDQTRGSAGDA